MADVVAELQIPMPVCLVCGRSTTMRCSGCKHAFYCGRTHSRQDWETHRNDCIRFRNSPQSQPLTCNAILFAANEMFPRMVKIPLQMQDIELYLEEPPDPHQILARTPWPRVTQPMWICRWYPGGPGLPGDRVLVAFHNDNFCSDGSPMNRAIYSLTSMGRGGRYPRHEWADDVFVLRKKSLHDPEFQNAVWEEDMPVLQSWFRTYN